MARYRIQIAYDGTHYFGWQKQSGTELPTVQATVEKALAQLLSLDLDKIKTVGSGRTDAGVHALDQNLHFDCEPPKSLDWIRGLNRYLPEDIRAQSAQEVSPDFHALKSAKSKTYTYSLSDLSSPNPLQSRYTHWVSSPIDLDYLNKLSEAFLGEHDFKSFQTVGTELSSTVRRIDSLDWQRSEQDGLVVAKITGNGFLKQMVRNMVGCLLHQYWKRPLTVEKIEQILLSLDRSKAFGTASAKGLCLHRVEY